MSTVIKNPLTGQTLDLGLPGIVTGGDPTPLNHSRVVLWGKPGCGKSTLLHSCPHAFVIDTQAGSGSVPSPYAFSWPQAGTPFTYRGGLAVLEALITKRPEAIRVVGIDLFADWVKAAQADFCARHKVTDVNDALGGYGKGWTALYAELFGLLDGLVAAGYGVVLTGHATNEVVRTKSGELILSNLVLPNKVRESIGAWADHVLWMERDSVTGLSEGKVVSTPVVTVRTRDLPGKFRGNQKEAIKVRLPLPESFQVPAQQGWTRLEEVFNAAIKELKAGYLTVAPTSATV